MSTDPTKEESKWVHREPESEEERQLRDATMKMAAGSHVVFVEPSPEPVKPALYRACY
jgi:hypothetical protein